jgi:hypothetical protein
MEQNKIPKLFGEGGEDKNTSKECSQCIDALTGSIGCIEAIAYTVFSYSLRGQAQECLDSITLINKYKEANLTWTQFKPFFKAEFAT